jgi:hypothetical protein
MSDSSPEKAMRNYFVGQDIKDAFGNVAIRITKITDGTTQTTFGGHLYVERDPFTGKDRADKLGNLMTTKLDHHPRELGYNESEYRYIETLPDPNDKHVWVVESPIFDQTGGIDFKASGENHTFTHLGFLEYMDKFRKKFDTDLIEKQTQENSRGLEISEAVAGKLIERIDTARELGTGLTPLQVAYIRDNYDKMSDGDLTKNFNAQFGTDFDMSSIRKMRQTAGFKK